MQNWDSMIPGTPSASTSLGTLQGYITQEQAALASLNAAAAPTTPIATGERAMASSMQTIITSEQGIVTILKGTSPKSPANLAKIATDLSAATSAASRFIAATTAVSNNVALLGTTAAKACAPYVSDYASALAWARDVQANMEIMPGTKESAAVAGANADSSLHGTDLGHNSAKIVFAQGVTIQVSFALPDPVTGTFTAA